MRVPIGLAPEIVRYASSPSLRLTLALVFSLHVPTGLAPEIVRFYGRNDPVVDPGARHSFLRPETMESLFVLYRVTGDDTYRQWGKRIFDNINAHARVDGGFASIRNVEVSRTCGRESVRAWLLVVACYSSGRVSE